jgi:DNA-binding GntR family transcriptional regulator
MEDENQVSLRPRSAAMAMTGEAIDETGKKLSLVDDAYGKLKAAIRDNEFPPGYQGSEQEIATRLGMSRTPVHEAVIRLQEEGLVRVLPRRGVVVCAISADDMREIYEVIIALECAAAELLAQRPSEERLATARELELANKAMEKALRSDDLTAWAKADELFHRLLIEHSGNKRLLRMYHTIMDQSHRARMITLRIRPKPEGSAAEHRSIVEAIKRGSPSEARELAKNHRVRASRQLIPLLRQVGLRHL